MQNLNSVSTSYYGTDSNYELCMADLLCDRYARPDVGPAVRYVDWTGSETDFSYGEISRDSASFATLLQTLGVRRGDRVATLLPKSPELVVSVLGIWRLGAVHIPLFTAFGPEAISFRLLHSATRVIVTNTKCRANVLEPPVPVISVEAEGASLSSGDMTFWPSLRQCTPLETPAIINVKDPFILIYTSGTTGHPKGVPVPGLALRSISSYMRNGLDVQPHDVFWNAADPGWAYGLYYALIGPLLMGKPVMFCGTPFDPQTTIAVLRKWQVTNFAAAPTAYRSIRAAGNDIWSDDPIRLRAASSAGESLNADLQLWASEHIGAEIYDHYGQTELGMVVMNHHHPELRKPLRASSMGHSTPGYRAVILDDDGRETGPDRDGHLAIDTEKSPLYWFAGYFGEEARTAERFPYGDRYYLTGDLARIDSEGYFFSRGRADDVISCAGYRVGPFEIETVLQSHPAVAEAAVVGKRDDLRGEIVKAFVVLRDQFQPSASLDEELKQLVKTRFAAHAYPKEIEFRHTLPRTLSGKLQRYLLRNNP